MRSHGGAGGTSPSAPFKLSVVLTDRWRLVNSTSRELFDEKGRACGAYFTEVEAL